MINNWDKFRDYENELLGSRSFYYNYKEELAMIEKEEKYIQDEIDNKFETLSDESYCSE